MLDCIEAWRGRHQRSAIILGKTVVAAVMIAGCSWVPDAVNPVEWYKGVAGSSSSDEPAPQIATPRRPEGTFPNVNAAADAASREVPRGLAADHQNSKYADSVRREPTPTKQLAKRQPAPAPVLAEATAAPEGQGAYQPSLDKRMRTARDEGPSAPPRATPGGPPARADIPDTVSARRSLLSDHYQKRLAESAAATNKNDPFAKVPPPRPESSYNQPLHTYAVPASAPAGHGSMAHAADVSFGPQNLVAPRGSRGVKGAKGAVMPSAPAASFQVASVQFGADGSLGASERSALKDVVNLYRQTGGVIKVVGLTAGAISFVGDDETVAAQRAATVAKALTAMGVPSRKVAVSTDVTSPSYDDTGARVSIEY